MASSETRPTRTSWVVLQNLQGSPELNGCLGQVFDYLEEKGRYEVFLPEVPDYLTSVADAARAFELTQFGFGLDFFGDDGAILAHDAIMRELCPALTDDAFRSTHQRCQHKLLKLENLAPYEGEFAEAMVVCSSRFPPCGKWEEVKLPVEHPIFATCMVGNSPVFELYGVPFAIARLPCNRSLDRAECQNQAATFLKIHPTSGFAPMTWQDYVGPVLIFRPRATDSRPKPLSSFDLEIVWEIITNLIDSYGNGPGSVKPKRDLTRKKFEGHVRNYLSACYDWNRKSDKIMYDKTGPYAGLTWQERMKLVEEHHETWPEEGVLSEEFDQQHLVKREGGLW